jgi:transcriptional regulator with XRE-family HTH domain
MSNVQLSIRYARKALGWSQRELARCAGMGQAHVMRVEQEHDVRLSTLQRLAKALGGEFVFLPKETAPLARRMGELAWKQRGLPSLTREGLERENDSLFTIENTGEES